LIAGSADFGLFAWGDSISRARLLKGYGFADFMIDHDRIPWCGSLPDREQGEQQLGTRQRLWEFGHIPGPRAWLLHQSEPASKTYALSGEAEALDIRSQNTRDKFPYRKLRHQGVLGASKTYLNGPYSR